MRIFRFTAIFCLILQPVAVTFADRVWLRDGSRLDGSIIELGGSSIAISTKQNRRKIRREEVRKVEFSLHDSEAVKLKHDLVLCRDGTDLQGTVSYSEDKRSVHVTFKDGNRVTVLRGDVLRILKRGEAVPGQDDSLYFTQAKKDLIARSLRDLSSPDSGRVQVAELGLKDLGIFAIADVETTRADSPKEGPYREALERIHLSYELKKAGSRGVEEIDRDVYSILSGTDKNAKDQLINDILLRNVEDGVRLAKILLLNRYVEPELRAVLVSLLGGFQRNSDLVELYERSSGRVQLSIAIALGRNRILLGARTLIEALALSDRTVRRLAIESLKDFTGEDFNYHYADLPQARKRSIARWEKWWKKSESGIKIQAESVLAGKDIETPQRLEARRLWEEALALVQLNKLGSAERKLTSAAHIDPTYFSVQLQLGVFLYTKRDKLEPAQKQLEGLLTRRLSTVGSIQISWVHYHLGNIRVLKGEHAAAIGSLVDCIKNNPEFLPAYRALGDLYYNRATGREELGRSSRLKALTKGLGYYRSAVDQIEEWQREMVIIVREDLPLTEVPPFDMREHNRNVRSVRELLRLTKSEIYLGMARIHLLLGHRQRAQNALNDGIAGIKDEVGEKTKRLQIRLRNYLGVLYEEDQEFEAARREYEFVLANLDQADAAARAGVKRLTGSAREAPGTVTPRGQ